MKKITTKVLTIVAACAAMVFASCAQPSTSGSGAGGRDRPAAEEITIMDTAKEIKYLNDYMEGLKRDFDISTVNHMDYAKEIAKMSLLKSKAYGVMLKDPSDDNIKSYKGLVSMFDNLSKSAQFAESQRSANDVGLGSFGQIFDAVEKNNWVPTYVPDDKDMYDKLLDQFANIEKSL